MNSILTFDYELFLGPETGTVDNCLIKPTDELLKIGNRYNVKFVFFVDTLFLLALKKEANNSLVLNRDYHNIISQLKAASVAGHDIELHIHPQWFYSSYNVEKNQWELDYTHYKLSDCSLVDVEMMISSSCELLKSITGYNPCAFRAGGYSVPQETEMWLLIKKYGIKYDSSVIVRSKEESLFQKYDYSSIKTPEPYCFSYNNTNKQDNGSFEEFPIATMSVIHVVRSLVERTVITKYPKEQIVFGDGVGIGVLNTKSHQSSKPSFFSFVRLRSSIDFHKSIWAPLFILMCKMKKYPYLVFIGHPKNQTLFSLRHLERLFRNKSFSKNTVTFRDLL